MSSSPPHGEHPEPAPLPAVLEAPGAPECLRIITSGGGGLANLRVRGNTVHSALILTTLEAHRLPKHRLGVCLLRGLGAEPRLCRVPAHRGGPRTCPPPTAVLWVWGTPLRTTLGAGPEGQPPPSGAPGLNRAPPLASSALVAHFAVPTSIHSVFTEGKHRLMLNSVLRPRPRGDLLQHPNAMHEGRTQRGGGR